MTENDQSQNAAIRFKRIAALLTNLNITIMKGYIHYVVVDGFDCAIVANREFFCEAWKDAMERRKCSHLPTYHVYGVGRDGFYDDDTMIF